MPATFSVIVHYERFAGGNLGMAMAQQSGQADQGVGMAGIWTVGMKRWRQIHQPIRRRIMAFWMVVCLVSTLVSPILGWAPPAWAISLPKGMGGSAPSTSKVSEVSPPPVIQELAELLEVYQPQVSLISPKPDEVLQDTTVKVQFRVKDLPLFQNKDLGLGPHLHVIVDNQPYIAVYDVSQPLVLKDLSPGTHTIRAFASRPWHESFKNEGAYVQTSFHVFTKTAENNPDPNQPVLTYSRPKGNYGAEPIMLDYYLANAPLHLVAQEQADDDIPDWRIRVTVNGSSFVLDRWQPLYLKGFNRGTNWVKLEFLDEQGNVLSNVFNSTARLVVYEPGGKDTLSRITRGEVTLDEVRGIVDPNYVYVPKQPEPAPTPSSTPSPTPSAAPVVPPTVPPVNAAPAKPVAKPVIKPTTTPKAESTTPKPAATPIAKPVVKASPEPSPTPTPATKPSVKPRIKPQPSEAAKPEPVTTPKPNSAIAPSPKPSPVTPVVPVSKPSPVAVPVKSPVAKPSPSPTPTPSVPVAPKPAPKASAAPAVTAAPKAIAPVSKPSPSPVPSSYPTATPATPPAASTPNMTKESGKDGGNDISVGTSSPSATPDPTEPAATQLSTPTPSTPTSPSNPFQDFDANKVLDRFRKFLPKSGG